MKVRKLSVSSKIILFYKTVQDYGNRAADICLVMQAVRQAGPLCDSYNLYVIFIQAKGQFKTSGSFFS